MLETGLGRAANLALSALPNFTLPGDTSASARYFAEDLTEPFVLDDGRLAVPTGSGLGVMPRPDALRALHHRSGADPRLLMHRVLHCERGCEREQGEHGCEHIFLSALRPPELSERRSNFRGTTSPR